MQAQGQGEVLVAEVAYGGAEGHGVVFVGHGLQHRFLRRVAPGDGVVVHVRQAAGHETGQPVEQAGGKVTTTGTPETADGFQYQLQVAGAEANTDDITIHVDPSDPTVVIQKESNDWTVSTILMLVLVILIALMAVILFLRLNRS